MKKRFLSMLLAIVMVVGMLPGYAVTVRAAASDTVTLYFHNTPNWGKVNIFTWIGGTDGASELTGRWPGSEMEDLGNGIWSYDVPAEAAMVIFNNGGTAQTNDLTIPADGSNLYDFSTETWSVYEAAPDNPGSAACIVTVSADPAVGGTVSGGETIAKGKTAAFGKEPTITDTLVVYGADSIVIDTPDWNVLTYAHIKAFADPVASVTTADNEITYYIDIAEAIAAAKASEGSTLTLLEDISTSDPVYINSGAFTIDLNGKTWTLVGEGLRIYGTADIILTDSSSDGTGKLLGSNNFSTLYLSDSAKLEILSGTLEGNSFSLVDMAVFGDSASELTVSGGTLLANGSDSTAITARGALVKVTGGTIVSSSGDISCLKGKIDLSGHSDPTGITIKNSTGTDVAVSDDTIRLPEGYALLDDKGNAATTLMMGETYTVGVAPATHSVYISAVDASNGVEIPGATVQLLDEQGDIVTAWISGLEAKHITDLQPCVIYTIRAVLPPDGYTVPADVTLSIDENGNVIYGGEIKDGVLLVKFAEAVPTITEVTFNSDSEVYDADTNTFYIDEKHPLVITVTGENLRDAEVTFYVVNSGGLGAIIPVIFDNDRSGNYTIDLSFYHSFLAKMKEYDTYEDIVRIGAGIDTLFVEDLIQLNVVEGIYDVELPTVDGCEVSTDKENPVMGDDVTITVTPDEGKEVDKVIVTDKNGEEVPVTRNEDGTYTYEQPAGDVTITVELKVKTYTVMFVDWDNTELISENVEHGQAAAAPVEPTRKGYTFIGWDKTFDNIVSALTVTAQYKINQYTITYKDTDGSTIEAITQDYGTEVEVPAIPTKVGYFFAGWNNGIPFTMPAENLTVTAQWTPISYTVVFHANNCTDDVIVQHFTYGEAQNLTPNTFTRDKHVFECWNTEADKSGDSYADGALTNEMTTVDGAVIDLYAIWNPLYTITVEESGFGTGTVTPETFINSASLTMEVIPNTGYTLKDVEIWQNDSYIGKLTVVDASGIPIKLEGNAVADLTLKMVFEPIDYTVQFHANGGTEESYSQMFTYGIPQELMPNVFNREGYSFMGWNTKADGTGTLYADLQTVFDLTTENGAAVHLYAQWKINRYTITFQDADGSTIAAYTQDYGTEVTAPAVPTRIGYIFAGWSSGIPATMPAENLIVTALWEVSIYTITFDTDGGSAIAPIEQAYNTPVVRPADPLKPGFSFAGWYADAERTEVYVFGTMPAEHITLYAAWNLIYIPIIPVTPSVPTYPPVVDGGDNGDVIISAANPEMGDTVVITPEPDAGYTVDEVTVTDKNGVPVTVISNGDGTYSFVQPVGEVNIEVTFMEIIQVCPGDSTCPMYGYTDLDMTAWYHDGVHFCIENKLMNGTDTNIFAPDLTTSRAMIVTILWRLAGEPVVNYAMSFADVDADQWYTEAVRWAASEGIVKGYSDTAFGPNDSITREQLAAILYRCEQKNGGGFKGTWMFRMDFADLADVSDWAYEAMCWMNMNGIVNGKPGNVLDPRGNAARAEAATMLYRYCRVTGKDNN